MSSPARQTSDSRPSTPRKRSESATTAPRPGSMQSFHSGPEGRDRSQSVTHHDLPQVPSAGFDSIDRVFPIRSVVSVDPHAASHATHARSTISPTRETAGARQYPIIDTHTWNELQSRSQSPPLQVPSNSPSSHPRSNYEPIIPGDTIRHETHATDDKTELASHSMASHVAQHPELYAKPKSPSQTGSSTTPQPISQQLMPSNEPYNHMTSRFTHVVTDSGHAVITGRDGESFQYCEDEPIRIPGAIQCFGVMIAMREEAPNNFVVRIVSENSEKLLGYTPKQLFEVGNFCDILSEDQGDTLLDHVDFVRDDAYDPSVDGPEVFILTIKTPSGESRRFWCAAHVSPSQKDLIICEFELEDDEVNPLNVDGQVTPAIPAETLGIFPSAEQFAASTINISQPLRVLRNARRRRGEAAAMDVFSILTQIQEQLGRANDLDQLLNTTAGLVKELTGFHRVLIYQFDSSWNGLVVAELVDPKTAIDLYKGLHFPASDIPAQARELYKINKVRLLYDRDHTTSRLVCRTLEDLETPLDMTHAYLRAMSPIHVKYLAHMKVRSSMSISVNAFNDLWGLISCHSYGSAGMRVSFPIRKMCRLLGDTVSRNIERLSYASRLQARKLINTVPTEANPSGYIIASSDDLLQLFDADYGALSIRDETKILGGNAHSQEVLALLEFLRMRQLNSVLASHDIIKDFPDLHYSPGLKAISGLLYVPLSTGGSDFIVFFRKGQLTQIKWAGNPYEIAKRKETAGYLEPRHSFAAWQETVLSQSREWSESDVETAAVLCLVYGKFIRVWRQKEAAMQNSQLTRLLLANSAHEVRTPLNAIINYLEIALEGALDAETRESLTKSHSASKSLIYVINDLLDLTNTETGQELIKDETFELNTTLQEAFDMLAGEAKRKNIAYSMSTQPGIPSKVLGDQRRVRQVFSNVISNAIQQTQSGAVTVELWRSANQTMSDYVAVEMMVVDTGVGMSKDKLEKLFSELEQVSTDENSYPEDEKYMTEEKPQQRVLGLGLALVARIVYSMRGQLGVKSEEGRGSRFKILLQFRLPEGSEAGTTEGVLSPHSTDVPPTPMISNEEFTLTRGSTERRETRRRSSESLRSGGSSRSGRSQADRLISAMQEPALVQKAPSEGSDMNRLRYSTSPQSLSRMSASVGSPPGPAHVRWSSSVQDPLSTLSTVTHTPPLGLQPMSTPPAPGTENITDSGVPMGPLRISERARKKPSMQSETSYFPPVSDYPGRVETVETISTEIAPSTTPTSLPPTSPQLMHVLVAEDDPVNSKIIHKRLTRLGHTVELTSNGEDCATTFRTHSQAFDVVLMDIQMPIADGYTATQMIREFESKAGTDSLSQKAKPNSRVPIFAVSASLLESERQKYIDTGFDGWVMKPIIFTRLNELLSGIVDVDARKKATYNPGEWENGGWF
ncbi:CheY-like superfamily [Penicillium malachiteum]|uniref:CheY-like superfamily n=1 Tax=Penicillium malachiteum TaxID=1324776 RepID=UPI0025482227|nr:CheY-like superfamily [Penicillium malachiteum]KAJ5715572.1 CheY-like superfamily [Penicillium malachiteum]